MKIHLIQNQLKTVTLLIAFWLTLNCSSTGGEPVPEKAPKQEEFTAAQIEFFEKTIRPLLIKRCYECHSKDEKEGGLTLDSREGILKGGDSGSTIDLKDHLNSLLLEAVSYKPDAVVEMPPDGRLTKDEITALTRWVKDGLPWPGSKKVIPLSDSDKHSEELFTEEIRKYWSFQPVKKPKVPQVKNENWVTNEIDAFILYDLEKNEMQPASKASKVDLIRRATFDLTGMPPTPQEVEEFVNDPSPEAYSKLIDRLLVSDAYGIRWGRHWLDVARYADSNGMDENMSYGYAFRYRDYVIDSFNRDKPYDLFVREQLAGDLMPDAENEQVTIERQIATGYLAIGAKMLAEDDPVKMRMDIIDEQIDTTGKAILGMTLGCARCHHHKFDPISTEDYYALAGIFKSTKTMKNYTVVADWFERPVEPQATIEAYRKFESSRDALTKNISDLKKETNNQLIQQERTKVKDYLLAASRINLSTSEFNKLAEQWSKENRKTGDSPSLAGLISLVGEKYDRGDVDILVQQENPRVAIVGTKKQGVFHAEYDIESPEDQQYAIFLQYAAHQRRPLKLFINGELIKPEAAGQTTGSWGPEGQRWFYEARANLKKGTNVLKLECYVLFPHINQIRLLPNDQESASAITSDQTDSLNPLVLEQWKEYLKKTRKDENSIFLAWNKLQDHIANNMKSQEEYGPNLRKRIAESLSYSEEMLAEHYEDLFASAESAWASMKSVRGSEKTDKLPDAELESFRSVLYDPKGPFQIPEGIEKYYPEPVGQQLATFQTEMDNLNKNAPAPLKMAMGVTENDIENMQVCIRGNHINLGKEVTRGVPKIMEGSKPLSIGEKESGRLELAKWITSPEHPLTSRVMANRIWRWHFGEGIVRTPDNFGTTGELPTNQPLLDWLATRFIEEGWSVKQMHRLIMNSSTYQMSSTHNPEYSEKDPENKLLWRMNRRRLEIEAIRDAVLSVAGTIDNSMGGTLLKIPNNQYVTGTASKITVEYSNTKRSVYLPVIRSALFEMFQAFDFPDPSSMQGDRPTTTIAPQALFMLNSDFMDTQTEEMARRLITEMPESDEDRLRRAYQLAYAREPSEDEMSQMKEFITQVRNRISKIETETDKKEIRTWKSVCRVILSSSEFISLN